MPHARRTDEYICIRDAFNDAREAMQDGLRSGGWELRMGVYRLLEFVRCVIVGLGLGLGVGVQ